MRLNEYFLKLQEDKISSREYDLLKLQCLRLVKKACRRYCLDEILYNKVLKYDLIGGVYLHAILKTLKSYNSRKGGSYSTYFYYKACSHARCEIGKLKRRFAVVNTLQLDARDKV